MKNILILFTLVFFLNGCSYPTKKPSFEQAFKDEKKCIQSNGDWMLFKELYPNRDLNADDESRYICNIRMVDKGKICDDNTQCGGYCQASFNAISGSETKGTCSSHALLSNNTLTISEGKVTYPNISQRDYTAKLDRLKNLKLNRAKWLSHGIISYQITLTNEDCFCLYGPYYGPNKVIVKNNKIKSVIYRGEPRDGFRSGDQLIKKRALKKTILNLFEDTELTIKQATENATLIIEYDETYGFPTIIGFDRPDMDHEEKKIVVSNFKYKK